MDPDLLDAATRRLYAAAAEDFTALRASLVDEAAASGDAHTARGIATLRKPTNAARVVNAYVAKHPEAAERLTALGDRLRGAQEDLDAKRMRELTDERRRVVADCVKAAFALAGPDTPSTTMRDDVFATFDAAVADPDVAARLGALRRPEYFSGFGFGASDEAAPPQLTLVRGGRNAPGTEEPKPAPKITAAQRRNDERELAAARERFAAADAALDAASTTERDAGRAVSKRERELARVKDALASARETLETGRDQVKEAKRERREARSALDRVERRLTR